MIGRPKITNKKQNISLTINKKLIKILDDYLDTKDINKSEYVEQLLKKSIKENNIKQPKDKKY